MSALSTGNGGGGGVAKKKSPFGQMLDSVRAECERQGIWTDELHRDLPKKWEKHGDFVILPQNAFSLPIWRTMGRDLWRIVAVALQTRRLGRKRRIADDEFRTPHIDLLYGDCGWVEHIDNGVRYNYDVTKCMFSIGNVTEKLRIASFDCKSEHVVDLFAGIGYFTLPFLVHAGAAHVTACDWNLDALEALIKNLGVNNVADRCTVLQGDCRKVSPMGTADRVNLGLLPTARQYWLTGCKCLKADVGGLLHIHDCVTSDRLPNRTNRVKPTAVVSQRSLRQDSSDAALLSTVAECPPTIADALPTLRHDQTRDTTAENGTPVNGSALSDDCVVDDETVSNGTTHADQTADVVVASCGRRKASRSQSIIDELESRLLPTPEIDTTLLTDGRWDKLNSAWRHFALDCAIVCCRYLNNLHEQPDCVWRCRVLNVVKVKSYAPHIDHLVVDLDCRPVHVEQIPFPKENC